MATPTTGTPTGRRTPDTTTEACLHCHLTLEQYELALEEDFPRGSPAPGAGRGVSDLHGGHGRDTAGIGAETGPDVQRAWQVLLGCLSHS
jgi:hypothetical protein